MMKAELRMGVENLSVSAYVHYGCLFCAPESWLNFDASPTLLFERVPVIGRLYSKNQQRFPANVRYGDIVKGLPVPAASCQGLYCSHVLEHLAREDCRKALRNSYNYLRPGGVFRMVLPDLEGLARGYLAGAGWDACDQFMRESMLGFEQRKRGLGGLVYAWLGNSRHLWMWDFKGLAHELAEAGFKNIRRASFGDAQDPLFREVEDKARFEGCLAIECVR
jgi:SAM-dependent methyltransferase